MTWFNNGVDTQTLAGSTSLTSPMLTAGVIPEGYIVGMTILRLLVRITYASAAATNLVNALFAFYVGTRGSVATPPNLNADLANYYLFGGLQAAPPILGPVNSMVIEKDIRSKRLIRGEDTDLFFRVTNNETSAMVVGMEMRCLLALH